MTRPYLGLLIAVACATALGLAAAWLAPRPDESQNRNGAETAGDAPAAPQPGRFKGAKRIVCLAPAVTDCLVDMDQTSRLVAVSRFCILPPGVVLQTVGGYTDPDVETLIRLAPDLIITWGKAGEGKIADLCRERGIPHMPIKWNGLDGLYESLATLGNDLGCEREAQCEIDRIKKRLDLIRTLAAGRPKPKTLFVYFHAPGRLQGAGTEPEWTMLGNLLALAGGDNVYAGDKNNSLPISLEDVLRRQPEVIIDVQESSPDEKTAAALREDWKSLSAVSAVRDGRIEVVGAPWMVHNGAYVDRVARLFFLALHPEMRGDPRLEWD
jgi:iron complex transport system substrate-binding protein